MLEQQRGHMYNSESNGKCWLFKLSEDMVLLTVVSELTQPHPVCKAGNKWGFVEGTNKKQNGQLGSIVIIKVGKGNPFKQRVTNRLHEVRKEARYWKRLLQRGQVIL